MVLGPKAYYVHVHFLQNIAITERVHVYLYFNGI